MREAPAATREIKLREQREPLPSPEKQASWSKKDQNLRGPQEQESGGRPGDLTSGPKGDSPGERGAGRVELFCGVGTKWWGQPVPASRRAQACPSPSLASARRGTPDPAFTICLGPGSVGLALREHQTQSSLFRSALRSLDNVFVSCQL